MQINSENRTLEVRENTFTTFSAIRFGIKELFKPNLTYRLGLLWLILDPIITAGIYGFLLVIVRGDFRGFSILLGVLTLKSMNQPLSRNSAANMANEPFPLMHTPTKYLLISRFSNDISQAAIIGLAGSAILILIIDAPLELTLHLTLVCMILASIGTCIGIIISPFAVVIRDIQKIVSYLLLSSLFLQAVLYDYSMTSGFHREFLSVLPHTFGVEWVRHIVTADQFPFSSQHVIKISIIWTLILFLGMLRSDNSRWRMTTWV